MDLFDSLMSETTGTVGPRVVSEEHNTGNIRVDESAQRPRAGFLRLQRRRHNGYPRMGRQSNNHTPLSFLSRRATDRPCFATPSENPHA